MSYLRGSKYDKMSLTRKILKKNTIYFKCEWCGESKEIQVKWSKFCSSRCRKAAERAASKNL